MTSNINSSSNKDEGMKSDLTNGANDGMPGVSQMVDERDGDSMVNTNAATKINQLFALLASGDKSIDLGKPFHLDLGSRGIVLPSMMPLENQTYYVFLLICETRARNKEGLALQSDSINKITKTWLISNPTLFKITNSDTKAPVELATYKDGPDKPKTDSYDTKSQKLNSLYDSIKSDKPSSGLSKEKSDLADKIKNHVAEKSKPDDKDEDIDDSQENT